ncbi:hypothetical protein [Arcobacter caeni]|uniref:FAD/FMN-containing dehydrogenase n=1 Tax=Arcobacter caeni TaxID=1912877 RepID=A0A363D4A7_9BACT|nr:hypothetical protein [Arcobacter caeni]PUE66134.1 hypothetical protein B0174_02385 [Arcobacter caeni]
MLKKLILSILICIYSNANTLKINDKISNFSLANQFDKIHTVNSEISMIIVTFQRNTSNLVNDFLSSKDSDFLHKKNTIFINNISSIPSIVTKMFIIPKMRDYKYDILLIYNENNKKFIEEENKITIYFIENSFVKDIKYISTEEELESILK